MTIQQQQKFVSWTWVVGLLLSLLLLIGGYMLNANRQELSEIKLCLDKKVERAEFYRYIESIDKKLDLLLGLHVSNELKPKEKK